STDTAPGVVQTVLFRVARNDDPTQFWNYQASTFTAAAVGATDLTPTLTSVWTYTTDYFRINTGTGAWENGRSYVVHEVITDKAGNSTDLSHAAFTFDITA